MRASGVVLSACALLVAAAPALGQAPAPPKPPAAEGKRGGVFRAPAPDASTLDPHLNATFSTHVYASLIYSGLVRFPAGPEIRAAGDARILPDVAEKWAWTNPTAELKPEDQSRYATMTFLGKFDKMAMGPFGAGVTEIDELLYETFFSASPRNRSRVNDPELDRMLRAQRREVDPARRREVVLDIQRYLADKAYYVYLPMWPRYITYPAYVKGFRNQDGASLGSRLIYTWFDR